MTLEYYIRQLKKLKECLIDRVLYLTAILGLVNATYKKTYTNSDHIHETIIILGEECCDVTSNITKFNS